MINSYNPKITRTKDPDIPGKRKAVNANKPATKIKNTLLKFVWSNMAFIFQIFLVVLTFEEKF